MQVTLTTFVSLDGVIQGPGGPTEDPSGGFKQGGWMVPYADEAMGRFVTDWFDAADAFLLGRTTYEIMAAYWPQVTGEDEVARKLNSLPKYVVSRTLDEVTWNNSTLIKGDPVKEIMKLKGEAGQELQVHGSGNLAQTLIRHGLIDEYRLWFHPLVLGSGKRLFPERTVPIALRLIETRTTSTGVVIHVYQPAGEPALGSFAPAKNDPGGPSRTLQPASTTRCRGSLGHGVGEAAQVADEQVGLLHGGEVAASVELRPLHDVREAPVG
jgi:dihydrofolate reductase